ncbi:MAG: response regulator, partial [Desulfuromonadales bacterium]
MNSEVKILAVDDVEMNLEMIEVMLEELGIQLYKAENGQEALDILLKEPDMDAILLDLEMPV